MFFDLIHVSRYTHIRDPGFPRRLYLYLLGEVSMGDSMESRTVKLVLRTGCPVHQHRRVMPLPGTSNTTVFERSVVRRNQYSCSITFNSQ